MGGAPPLPLGFAPQGAKKGTFLHFSAPEDQPGGFEGTQANRLPRAGHLRSLPPTDQGSPRLGRGSWRPELGSVWPADLTPTAMCGIQDLAEPF